MKWNLDNSASALLHTMTGSDDEEEATPVTLFVGESRDDDGKPVYGLHAYESEYPEEGVTPLVLMMGTCAPLQEPRTIERAFQIADESMFGLLETEAVPYDSPASEANAFGLADEQCQEVTTLEAASPAMREAFEWLHGRGYVELGTDGVGSYIRVIRRPSGVGEVTHG